MRDGDVWAWSQGGAERVVANGAATDACWSPNGRQVLFVQESDSYSDLVLYDLASGTNQQLTFNAPPLELEPGSELYVNRSSWVVDPSWSESGRIAFVADFDVNMDIWLMDSPGGAAVPALEALPDERAISGVDLAPSGVLVAFTLTEFNDVSYHTSVWLRDLSDGSDFLIADEPNGAYDPAISPNETSIALSIRADGDVSDLWLVSRSDGSEAQLTNGAQASSTAWSPDGAWLAYLRPNGNEFELWALPMLNEQPLGEAVKLGSWGGVDAPSGLSWTLNG